MNGYRNALATHVPGDSGELGRALRFERLEQDLDRHLREFSRSKEPPDAFYCLNNNIAMALLLALRKKQFKKLSDARVASFDDLELFDLLDKKVTAVSQPVEEIGRTASEVLLEIIAGKKKDQSTIVLPTRLVKR
jgi:DNA-binding LacI/PurR family transcriptional regulator